MGPPCGKLPIPFPYLEGFFLRVPENPTKIGGKWFPNGESLEMFVGFPGRVPRAKMYNIVCVAGMQWRETMTWT